MRKMKNIRILGIDDAHFIPHSHGHTKIVGVVMRLNGYIDGFLFRDITVDGNDSTEAVISMLKSKYAPDIRVIMTQGITVGGFNILDIRKICTETGKKVVVISRKKPDLEKIKKALRKNFYDYSKRISLIESVEIEEINAKGYKLYIQRCGIEMEDAKRVIESLQIRGAIPEPIRIAHLVASAIYLGESKGKP